MAQRVNAVGLPWTKSLGHWTIGLVSVALFTGAFGVYALSRWRSQSSTPTTPTLNQVALNSITAMGRIQPQGEIRRLSTPTDTQAARIGQLLVQEGDRVRSGQIVAILDTRDRLSGALEKAKKEVNIAKAQLAKVEAGVKTGELQAQNAKVDGLKAQLQGETTIYQQTLARLRSQLQGQQATHQATLQRLNVELSYAQTESNRYQMLYNTGAIAAIQADSKRLAMNLSRQRIEEEKVNFRTQQQVLQRQIDETQAKLNQAQATLQQDIKQAGATLNQLQEVRPTDLQLAEAEVDRALTAVTQAQADLDTAFVRSPVTGHVLKVYTRAGERVSDRGIVEVGQTDRMYVVAEVLAQDIPKVRLGQRVVIQSDRGGFEGKLQGSVDRIGIQLTQTAMLDTGLSAPSDPKVVEVKIRLDPEDSQQVTRLTNLKVKVAIDL